MAKVGQFFLAKVGLAKVGLAKVGQTRMAKVGLAKDGISRVNCMRKMTCELYLSTLPAGHSGSTSTVNETNCNKKVI